MDREFFRKVQLFLMLALGTYPVLALICVFFMPQAVSLLWPFSAAFLAAGCLLLLLPKKLKYAVFALACVGFFALAFLLAGPESRAILVFFALCYGGLLFWQLQIRDWDSSQEIPSGWMALWLAALILGYVLSFQIQLLTPAAPILRIGMFVYVFLGMCSLNRSSLYVASGGKSCITPRMARNNLLLVAGMFGLALVASLFSTETRLWAVLLAIIQSLRGKAVVDATEPTEFLESIATTVATEATEAIGGGGGIVETTETLEELPPVPEPPSWLIGFYIAAVVVGALFVLIVLISKWVDKPKKEKKIVRLGVEDEITSIRKEERQSEKLKREKKETLAGWLSPTMRIRRRYKSLSNKNPHWGKSSTARENLREEAAKIYEKTRYSSHTVTDRDAEDFKNNTK